MCECVYRINLAQDRDQWLTVVNSVMSIRIIFGGRGRMSDLSLGKSVHQHGVGCIEPRELGVATTI